MPLEHVPIATWIVQQIFLLHFLFSQTCGAVVYRGFETLVVVGAKVTNFLGQIMIHAGYPNNGLEQLKVTDPCYLPPVDFGKDQTKSNTYSTFVIVY